MSEVAPADESLTWPPSKEVLEQLYLQERLSAMKIAQRYRLEYDNPKSGESMVLYYLKRFEIARRDAADHIKKVNDEIVEEWIRRYRMGESLKQIAGDRFSPATVYLHLRKQGVKLRDKVEAQIKAVTKHEKRSFTGDPLERAYLVGLASGDLFATKHGRAIRVRVSTTHPAMARLFRDIFEAYGPIYEYPKQSPLQGFEWCLDCDLDSSFSFLLDLDRCILEGSGSKEEFISFVAGFFDAEGSVYYHKKKGLGGFEVNLTNTNENLLARIAKKLEEYGYSPNLRLDNQKVDRGVKNGGNQIWRLTLWRFGEVTSILRLLPFRHAEKSAKASIVLGLPFRPSSENRHQIIVEWDSLKQRIRQDCVDYVAKAEEDYNGRRNKVSVAAKQD